LPPTSATQSIKTKQQNKTKWGKSEKEKRKNPKQQKASRTYTTGTLDVPWGFSPVFL